MMKYEGEIMSQVWISGEHIYTVYLELIRSEGQGFSQGSKSQDCWSMSYAVMYPR